MIFALAQFRKMAIAAMLISVSSLPVLAQSQALNGQIEGTVTDQDHAAVSGAQITALNIETGATRTAISSESGVYRLPLLPLGTYRITVEAADFKRHVRDGVTLSAGQTATIDVNLTVGEVAETVNVSSDAAIADPGKIVIAAIMDRNEVQNLPLISRNPLNFALLQTNVTGRPNRSYINSNVHVNGYLRRVNYQLDGNGNTSYDRRIRFALVSETFVSEIQLITNGFAAEFGHTPGMIMNIITPSGTNKLKGAVSYRFRRPGFYSRPFFYPSASDIPDNGANIFTASVGGPIVNDRWHFYFGYERGIRDDQATAPRLSTILPADRDRLIAAGLPAAIFPAAIPSSENGSFYIFRSDAQVNENNRLTIRYNHSDLVTRNPGAAGKNTLERGSDRFQADHSMAVQLASYTTNFLNEFRFQYGRQHADSIHNKFTGSGVAVNIRQVANFGPPFGLDTVSPASFVTEFQNNLTRTTATQVIKIGGGMSFHSYTERAGLVSRYTFPNITAYINALNGIPDLYTRYDETFGDPEINTTAAFANIFAQSDWKATRRLKFNYGLRYDLYRVPKADTTSPFPLSREFRVDKNDLSPRLGVVYAFREGKRPTVIRAGAGIYYDAPFLGVYRDVIHVNGNARFVSLSFEPGEPGSPQFPNNVGSLPGAKLPPQEIYTITPDYETSYVLQTNIQLEQALREDLSLGIGFVHSGGRHITVYRNINPTNIIRYLADGRPVFGDERLDPRFNTIVIAESTGNAQYDALALQLTQRLWHGVQFRANYTLSRAINDTPDGDIEGIFLSDPTNRSIDKGYSSADQRHTFVLSFVARPQFHLANSWVQRILSNNQVGIIAIANSGARFNIKALGPGDDGDLNSDGFSESDRPAGIPRNAGKTPPQFNMDLRYSRFITFSERHNLELTAEFTNVFNINRIVSFNDVTVPTTSEGVIIGGLPDFRARNASNAQDSRQLQFGLKFHF